MVVPKALELLKQRREALNRLDPTIAAWDEVVQWYVGTRQLIVTHFQTALFQFDQLGEVKWHRAVRFKTLDGDNFSQASASDKRANDSIARRRYAELLSFMDGLIQLAEIEGDTPAESIDVPVLERSNRVFIVHGQSEEMKQSVARALQQLRLQPVILHEQINEGATIIEKFVANSDVGFAVVLLSPDDVAHAANTPTMTRNRARQNVVFEMGYFIGKLGRKHVFALKYPGDIELPSDYNAVVYEEFDAVGKWRFTLAKELRAAGYTIDVNELL